MRAWRRLPAALGAVAIVAIAAFGSLAQNASNDNGSLWDIVPKDVQNSVKDVATGVVITEAIKAVDDAAKQADQAPVTLQSSACAAFQGLTTDAQIDARLAAIQAWLASAQREQTAADAAEQAAENDARDLRDQANIFAPPAQHDAASRAANAARETVAKAQARLRNARRTLADARAAAQRAKPCADAARALLPQQPSTSAAPGAPQSVGSAPVAPPGPFNMSGQLKGTFSLLCPYKGNDDRWSGTFTVQANGAGAFYGPITWTQLPADSGLTLPQQGQWTFAVQASGDVNDPQTIGGAMNGHIDPATRTGSGTFSGPCPLYFPPVNCSGSWTTTAP